MMEDIDKDFSEDEFVIDPDLCHSDNGQVEELVDSSFIFVEDNFSMIEKYGANEEVELPSKFDIVSFLPFSVAAFFLLIVVQSSLISWPIFFIFFSIATILVIIEGACELWKFRTNSLMMFLSLRYDYVHFCDYAKSFFKLKEDECDSTFNKRTKKDVFKRFFKISLVSVTTFPFLMIMVVTAIPCVFYCYYFLKDVCFEGDSGGTISDILQKKPSIDLNYFLARNFEYLEFSNPDNGGGYLKIRRNFPFIANEIFGRYVEFSELQETNDTFLFSPDSRYGPPTKVKYYSVYEDTYLLFPFYKSEYSTFPQASQEGVVKDVKFWVHKKNRSNSEIDLLLKTSSPLVGLFINLFLSLFLLSSIFLLYNLVRDDQYIFTKKLDVFLSIQNEIPLSDVLSMKNTAENRMEYLGLVKTALESLQALQVPSIRKSRLRLGQRLGYHMTSKIMFGRYEQFCYISDHSELVVRFIHNMPFFVDQMTKSYVMVYPHKGLKGVDAIKIGKLLASLLGISTMYNQKLAEYREEGYEMNKKQERRRKKRTMKRQLRIKDLLDNSVKKKKNIMNEEECLFVKKACLICRESTFHVKLSCDQHTICLRCFIKLEADCCPICGVGIDLEVLEIAKKESVSD